MNSGGLKIRVEGVSLKLKFKCRMRVEWKHGCSSTESDNTEGVFKFDQQISLRLQQGAAQLNLALITDKGSLYSGGKVKLIENQLKSSVGQTVRLPILKCIDKEAWIQIKILRFWQNEQEIRKKDISFTQLKEALNYQAQTPQRNVRQNLFIETNGQTKSEYGFQIPLRNIHPPQHLKNKVGGTSRRDFLGQFSMHRESKQPRDSSPHRSSPRRESPEEWLYRQQAHQARRQADYSASKLRSVLLKYRQEQEKTNLQRQKRKQLEAAQQSHKMEIIRLKLSKEQSEAELAKKNAIIKELTSVNSGLKEAEKKLAMFIEQVRRKQQEINFLQDKIKIQNQQIQEIKRATQYQIDKYSFQLGQFKKECQNAKKNQNALIEQLRVTASKKEEQLNLADIKRVTLEQDLQKQRKNRSELQLKLRQQIMQLQKSTTLLKRQIKSLSEELISAKNTCQKQKAQLIQIKKTSKQENEKERMNLSKMQFEKNSIQQQLQENQQKLKEIRKKYQEQTDKYKSMKEEYQWNKRKLESVLEENYKLEDRLRAVLQQNQAYIQQINSLVEKQRIWDDKLTEYQQQLQQNRILAQKQKMNQESYKKDYLMIQQKERQFKFQLNKRNSEIGKLRQEVESLNMKLTQTREALKFQTSKKMRTLNSIQEQWEESKLNSILETQKFLEMQVVNQKQVNVEIQLQYGKAKEELQKFVRAEMEWKEQQRIWQSQKEKYVIQNSKLARQIKELTKKIGEEEVKVFSVSQRLQKQIKLSKQSEERAAALQNSLKNTSQQRDIAVSNYNHSQQNFKALSNDVIAVRTQIQYIQNEKQKIQKIYQDLCSQNKKLKEQVSLLAKRLKDQQEKYTSDLRKIKQELNKSQLRAVNFKKQSDKFKENLRNILVDSILSNVPRNQQDYEVVLKKKQEKLGFTLTSQLLIRAEDYFKELHRHQVQLESKVNTLQKDLMSSREQIIMRTNQFQNSEGQLKSKMEELLENLQKMKQIYENRQRELRKQINDEQWQIASKNQEISKLKQARESLNLTIESLSDRLQTQQKQNTMLNQQINKLKMSLKEADQKQILLMDQIRELEDYSIKMQEDMSSLQMQIEQLTIDKQRIFKSYEEVRKQFQSCTQSVSQQLKQKKQMKELIFSLQSQTQQLKLKCDRYQQQTQGYEKEKIQQSNLVRTIMKEKQSLLRQYLQGEQKVSALQNKQFEMNQKIIQLTQEIDTITRNCQEVKKNFKSLQEQVKMTDLQCERKQSYFKQIEGKYKDMQKLKNNLQQVIERAKNDREKQKKQYELAIRSKQEQYQESCAQVALKNIKIAQLEEKVKKDESRFQQIESQMYRLKSNVLNLSEQREENMQKLTEYIQREEQLQIEMFSYKTEIGRLKQELIKIQQELRDRDLKNFQLSSEIYRLQTQSSSHIHRLTQQIDEQQIQINKYEQMCDQYTARIDQLQRENSGLENQKKQFQEEIHKLQNKIALVQEERDVTQKKNSLVQNELFKIKDTNKRLVASKQYQQKQMNEAITETNSRLQRKQLQFERLKKQNQVINQSLQAVQQRLLQKQKLLNQQIKRGVTHQQTVKKMQMQFKKVKQNWKQLHWTSQREIKKVIQAKVHFLNEIQVNDSLSLPNLGDCLKGLQQSILDVIKKYSDS